MADFAYTPMLPVSGHDVTWRRLDLDTGVRGVRMGGEDVLQVDPEVLTALASAAYQDVSHLLRPAHLAQLRKIVDDPAASSNDRYVALELLRNAVVSSGGVLPMCQDTGTATIVATRGHRVWTDGRDAVHLSRGVFDTYRRLNLRYSQMAAVSLWDEVNTGSNLPAQIDISLGHGAAYEFLFLAKGGGSANKTFLYQESKAVLDHDHMLAFLREKVATLGTAACPPYHLAVVIGGTSAEANLKAAKLASAHHLDGLPTRGSALGHGFRDPEFEAELQTMTEELGFGAQFGGKYFCHDVRVVRLPRHGGSLPISISVSCSADRQVLARIDRDGVFLEALETDPARFLPDIDIDSLDGSGSSASGVRHIDLDQPMPAILAALDECPVATRLSLTGPLVVARDIAHARIRNLLDAGGTMPDYLRDHPVYYAGPAKKPGGLASGSFGPTTAGRMDSYVEQFQEAGGSLVMLAKGNRSAQVTRSCQRHGGFYLGSVGGPAARLARDCIRSVEVIDFPDLGMEAVFRIEVEDFPAFVVVDNKGNDFFVPSPSTLITLGPTRRMGG